ncbi:MAG: DUF5722 domain-containing protein [Eubacteriales bacterium]|nr:DUF5722 domain-containing protein [Eubacteriales bacterium]
MKRVIQICLLMILLVIGGGSTVFAAYPAAVQEYKISKTDKKMVVIRASAPASVADSDGNYYVFGVLPEAGRIDKNAILAAQVRQQSNIAVQVPLNLETQESILYRKIVLAVKHGNGSYEVISRGQFLTNPEVLAPNKKAFSKAVSKKGLHIQPQMLADAEDLSVKHAVVNICLDTFIASSSMSNQRDSYEYTYQGRKYWFTRYACAEVDRQVKKLSESKVLVSGVLLLRNQGAGAVLVPPKARKSTHAYYGFNVMDKSGTETLAALMSFLGERYMNSSGQNGTIVNWIVGNEINDYGTYNYMGKLSFEEYVSAYAHSFRVVSTALRSVYSNARVYISLNHLWKIYQTGGNSFYAKDTLDGFAGNLKEEGDIPWNLAFHPYPAPLTDAKFWDDPVTDSDSTAFVTMKNIHYLTTYVTEHFRKDVRIILSEQGFTSQKSGTTNQKLQAAAFAYAYYLAESEDKIDAFIMNRHVDHQEETKQNLFLGIWTNQKGALENASKKKSIWEVFKYIDSASSEEVTAFTLKYLPGKSFQELIPGFSFSKFRKMGSYHSGAITKGKKAENTANKKTVRIGRLYSYTGTAKAEGKTIVVSVAEAANRNLYQGAGFLLTKPLNMKNRSAFLCSLNIRGMKEKNASVRIRFFSGKNVYEASTKVKGGGTRKLKVRLNGWKYRKKITKIQIWVRPFTKKGWQSGSAITISGLGTAKR